MWVLKQINETYNNSKKVRNGINGVQLFEDSQVVWDMLKAFI